MNSSDLEQATEGAAFYRQIGTKLFLDYYQEWQYLSEGNASVVFYSGESPPVTVLRVPKANEPATAISGDVKVVIQQQLLLQLNNDKSYRNNTVLPLIGGAYLAESQYYLLGASTIQALTEVWGTSQHLSRRALRVEKKQKQFLSGYCQILPNFSYVSKPLPSLTNVSTALPAALRRGGGGGWGGGASSPTEPHSRASLSTSATDTTKNTTTSSTTSPPGTSSPTCTTSTLCVEIKVKCGLVSQSPFVEADRAIKKKLSRFDLMQLHKTAKAYFRKEAVLETKWGLFTTTSKYCPSNICSGCQLLVRAELDKLMNNPQNNFIISLNGTSLYGLALTEEKHYKDVEKSCAAFFATATTSLASSDTSAVNGNIDSKSINHDNGGHSMGGVSLLKDVLASILCEEKLLKRIEVLQSMDVLDTEGAALLFTRLIEEYCNGSVELATKLVEEALTRPWTCDVLGLFEKFLPHSLNTVSSSSGCTNMNSIDELKALREQLMDSSSAYTSTYPRCLLKLLGLRYFATEINTHRSEWEENEENTRRAREAMRSVYDEDEMTEVNICFLLKLWLVALAARDCGIMVALEPLPITNRNRSNDYISKECRTEETGIEIDTSSRCSERVTIMKQTVQTAGVVCISDAGNNGAASATSGDPATPCLLCYSLNMIDIGPKPVVKIINKNREDLSICKLVTKYLEENKEKEETEDDMQKKMS